MKTINANPKAFGCQFWLTNILLMLFSASFLQAQITMSASQMPKNQFMTFPTGQSMFYYNDLGPSDPERGILMAMNSTAGGSMMYSTYDDNTDNTFATYVVGHGSDVLISKDYSDLQAVATDAPSDFSPTYKVQINSPSEGTNASLSLFFMQLQEDISGERFMFLDGIGVAVIEDIDPASSQSIQISNDIIFSLKTITISAEECGNTGTHALIIEW